VSQRTKTADRPKLPGYGPAIVALAGSLVAYAVGLLAFPSTGDQDAALHALHSLFPTEPARLLSVWSRPLMAVPYLIPAQLGYPAMRVFTVLIAATAAWLTYLTARRLSLAAPWLAIPLVLLQPCFFPTAVDTMTEPAFALCLALALFALVHDRVIWAGICLSFLPLARPEGPLVIALTAVAWLPAALRQPRYRWAILSLGVGMVVWELGCLAATRDPLFLLRTFPWQVHSQYAPGPLDHYVRRWGHIVGIVVYGLSIVGVIPSLRQPLLRLCVAFSLATLALHSALFAMGSMSSTGFDRYFGTMAPAIALVAVRGADVLRAWAPELVSRALVPLAIVQGVQALVLFDGSYINHGPAATVESVRQAQRQLDLRGRRVVSADNFGYVFLNRDADAGAPPVADRTGALASIGALPAGTVVLWDDMTGDWWYHLSVDDFLARGYRVVWARELILGSRFARWYSDEGITTRPFRQAVLVREPR
jgi:hypothetical protein